MNPASIQLLVNAVLSLAQMFLSTHATPTQAPIVAGHVAGLNAIAQEIAPHAEAYAAQVAAENVAAAESAKVIPLVPLANNAGTMTVTP